MADPVSNELRPFLRWAGSKHKLLPKLIPFWRPAYGRYVEPFMGSACLFFKIQPMRGLLSDINSELVGTFIAVRDQPKIVYREITRLSLGRESYYKVRALNTANLSAARRAARFIYLNRFCFNGLYRTNLSGQFNVPYGGSKTGNLPSQDDLLGVSQLLKRATVLKSDFEEVLLKRVRKGDFVYLDPPFAVNNRRVFRQYGQHTFGLEDIQRLSRSLDIIHKRGAHFILSYAYCKEAAVFRRWNVSRVYVQRNISGFARHRKKSAEVLVTNI